MSCFLLVKLSNSEEYCLKIKIGIVLNLDMPEFLCCLLLKNHLNGIRLKMRKKKLNLPFFYNQCVT